MDPETKQLLKENLEVARENNIMLNKMVRNQKWTNVYRIVYWSIIILSSVGAYYFIQPFLGNLFNVYTGGAGESNGMSDILNNLSNKGQIESLINTIR